MDRSIKTVIYYMLKGLFRSTPNLDPDRLLQLTTPKDIRHWVTCNGKRLGVTQNLYNAMLNLRQTYPERRFWIDALSINQGDVDERNKQVRLMSRIYSSAEKVVAWIGEVPATLQMFKAVNGIVYLAEVLQSDGLADVQTHSPAVTPAMYDHTLIFMAVASFYILSRRWFRRAWIVQELVVAKDFVILFGRHELAPEMLMKVMEFVNDPVRRGVISNLILSTLLPAFGTSVPSFRELLNAREKFDVDKLWDLGEFLLTVRGRSSSEPRDMVFAGLGLIDKASLSIKGELTQQDNAEWNLWQSLQVNYSASLKDVYVNCAAALLSGRTGLYALAYAGSGRSLAGLPSWIPTLGSRRIMLKEHVGDTAKAGGNSSQDPNISISENGMVLTLHDGAELFDKVDTMIEIVGFSEPKICDIIRLFSTLPDIYEPTGERTLLAIARTLIADCLEGQSPAPESVEDELVHWMENLMMEEKKGIYRKAAKENEQEDYDPTKDLSTNTKVKELTHLFDEFSKKHGRQSQDCLENERKGEATLSSPAEEIMVESTTVSTETPSPPLPASDVSHPSTTAQSYLATTDVNSQPTPAFFKQSSSFLTALDKVCSEYAFFITSEGYIGMGPRDMRSKHKDQKEEQHEREIPAGLESPVPWLRPVTSIMVVAGAESPFAMNAVCDFVDRQPFSVMGSDRLKQASQKKQIGIDGPGMDLNICTDNITADTNEERVEVLEAAEQNSWQDGTAMYEISGEVYVHGIMRGERTRSEEWGPRKIHLL